MILVNLYSLVIYKKMCLYFLSCNQMTGLDIEKDTILDIACVITDSNLKVQSEDFNVVINQPDSVLGSMNEWSTIQHNKAS